MTTPLIEAVARAMKPEAWIETPAEDFEGTQAKWDRLQRTDREITIIKAQQFVSRLNATGTHVVVPVELTEETEDAFWTARDDYERLKAERVFPRPALSDFLWSAMLKAAQEE